MYQQEIMVISVIVSLSIICFYCSNIVPFLKRFGLNPVTGEVYLLLLSLTELSDIIIWRIINVLCSFS